MQTEDDYGKTSMLNSPSDIIKKLPNEDVEEATEPFIVNTKKEPRDQDSTAFVTAKKEPREDDRKFSGKKLTALESNESRNSSRSKESLNGKKDALKIEVERFTGVLDITEESSSDGEHIENSDDLKGVSNCLKKEEFNEVKMLDDQNDMLNEEDDLTYSNGSNDQYSLSIDNNDQFANDFSEEDGTDNNLGDEGTDEPNEEFDGDNTGDNDEDENASRETDDNNDCDSNVNDEGENATEQNASTGEENMVDEQAADTAKKQSSETAESAEDHTSDVKSTDKEPESETHDSKRPASRESVTSTTSNSSERLTVRSTNDINTRIFSVADVYIKKEKAPQDQGEEQSKEKPHVGLSVLNPSQLGVSNSGGENLLQNVNFAQPNDQMNVINYIGGTSVAVQCEVCEAQFPDSMILADHRAAQGHYKCLLSPDCNTMVFSMMSELSAHQQSVHGVMSQSPVQQLAHQVQSLPIRYEMSQQMNNNYPPPMQQYPPQAGQAAPRPLAPQVYPGSPNNMQQIRGYSIANQPRLQMAGAMRGNVPNMTQPPPLKRQTLPPQPRITPTKRARTDYTRNGDADCKVVSVQKPDNTDDVVAQLSKSITITARQDTRKKNDTAAAVTNMLANRGITVSSVPAKQNQNNSAVQMLNLNSAVSLIPTSNANNRQARTNGRPIAPTNSSRMTTVDLTGPDPPRGMQMVSQRRKTTSLQCQICDRIYATPEQLNQHMITHGNVNRTKQMPYKCNQCTAQYPNQQQLQHHKQTFHRDSVSSTNEMAIPIVNVKQPGTMQKLSAIGVHHVIPLNALGTQSPNGTFGIPILPLSFDRNQQINMSNCGITNILPIGPLKTLGR